MRKTGIKPNYIYILVDIIFIGLSTYIPYILRFNRIDAFTSLRLPFIWSNLELPAFSTYSFLFLFWGIITILIFNNYHLYTTDRELTIPKETLLVLKAAIFASLPIIAGIFIFKVIIFSRLLFGMSLVSMFISLSLWRIIKRSILRRLITGGFHNLNVLIIGAGRIGKFLVDEINAHPYLGLKIVGFLDDFKQKGESINDYKILGIIDDLGTIIRKQFIDEVLITIPSQHKAVQDIIAKCMQLKVSVKIVPDLYDVFFGDMKIYHLGIIPALAYYSRGIHGTDLFLKRLLDIFISGVLLLLLSPLFIIIAFFIKLDSPGPVFYRSIRCGKKGKQFVFYKFRSMVENADKMLDSLRSKNEKKGPVFKMKHDPRITKVGKVIRKFSLDELPQLWNVFQGHMSLVGPRPPTKDEVSRYDNWQIRRLEIKPGITCLWQVRGRSELSFYKWIKWDIWYIDNWSFGLDLKILFWTLPAVFKARGAY